ncbi:MAG: hypothetical protein LQ347_006545 [Umbilicaria vellea]|nr:MAG: hypothetical protein LQ347_006545 [Umbilicaria vellea]
MLLDLEPVSVRQLTGLVDVISGYSNALQHSVQDTMDVIIQSMANLGPESWPRLCFQAIPVKHIADIFLRCFEAIQQVEGGYLEISGEQGLLWIATVLLWLNPDEVGLFSRDRLLFGTAGGKVRIFTRTASYISESSPSTWMIRTWKAGKSITTMISEDFLPVWAHPRRTGHKIIRRNVRHYLLERSDVEAQIESADLVGALAAGLIDAALLYGTVEVCRSASRTQVVRLGLFYDETFLQKGGCVMEEYGWDLEYIRANATKFLARFTDSVDFPISSTTDARNMVVRIVESFEMDAIDNLRREFDDLEVFEYEVSKIVDKALGVAGHALASAHVNFGTLVQFYYPDLASGWRFNLFSNMQLEWFLEQIYKVAGVHLSALPEPSSIALIRSSEGRVVIPQVMLDHSTRRDGLFRLVVIPGRIHYEGSCFNAVVGGKASYPPSGRQYEAPRRVPIFDQNTRQSVLLVPDERNTVTLKYFFAMDQRLLFMKTCLSSDQDGFAIDVDYSDCLRNLAFAFHVIPSKKALGLSDNSMKLSLSRWDDITLIKCLTYEWHLDSEVLRRFVTHVPDSQELRFFASHSKFQPQDCALYILQGAELVEALYSMMTDDELAPFIDKPWRVITGKDR